MNILYRNTPGFPEAMPRANTRFAHSVVRASTIFHISSAEHFSDQRGQDWLVFTKNDTLMDNTVSCVTADATYVWVAKWDERDKTRIGRRRHLRVGRDAGRRDHEAGRSAGH